MTIAKDDLIAALRLRYDYYSAQTMFDLARERAMLVDQPAYAGGEVVAFRAALATVGDRLGKVDERLAYLLEQASSDPAPSRAVAAPTKPAAPTKVAEPAPTKVAEPAPTKAAEPAPTKAAEPAPTKAEAEAAPGKGAEATIETVLALTGVEVGDDEQILVCGGLSELGDWDPARARPMSREGDQWLATIGVSPDAEVAFKFLRRRADGAVVWEGGENRNLIGKPRIDAVWR